MGKQSTTKIKTKGLLKAEHRKKKKKPSRSTSPPWSPPYCTLRSASRRRASIWKPTLHNPALTPDGTA